MTKFQERWPICYCLCRKLVIGYYLELACLTPAFGRGRGFGYWDLIGGVATDSHAYE